MKEESATGHRAKSDRASRARPERRGRVSVLLVAASILRLDGRWSRLANRLGWRGIAGVGADHRGGDPPAARFDRGRPAPARAGRRRDRLAGDGWRVAPPGVPGRRGDRADADQRPGARDARQRQAQSRKAPFVRLANRYALGFVPVTLLIAGAAWLLSGDPVRALAVLVVATPCPLILAAPVAIVSGMSQ